jgi:hypothetical protein
MTETAIDVEVCEMVRDLAAQYSVGVQAGLVHSSVTEAIQNYFVAAGWPDSSQVYHVENVAYNEARDLVCAVLELGYMVAMGTYLVEHPDNTCKNCDKPCSGKYCSSVCEDMDRLPAPTND